MKRIAIADGVEYLEAPRQESWLMNNGLLIAGEENVMIDGRFGDEETLAFIRENNVSRYFISHFHIDHVSGAWRIKAQTNCSLALNQVEHTFIQSGESLAQATGYRQEGIYHLVESIIAPRMGFRCIPGVAPYDLAEIEAISKGQLRVIKAPGHSPGHFCLYAPQSDSLFACDLGFDRFGPWYGFPHCHLAEYFASINTARELKARQLFSSHSPMVTEGVGKAFDRCQNIIEKRHSRVLSAWNKGKRTAREIAGEHIFYPRTDRFGKRAIPVVAFWQETMVRRHLEYAGLTEEAL